MTHTDTEEAAYLIVNADDYGYSTGVSRGILQSIENGIVTATGILANSPFFDEVIPRLLQRDDIDTGVHLTLTSGSPLTSRMKKCLGGAVSFPAGKYSVMRSILSGTVKPDDVYTEWEAQIERCLSSGLTVRFLNSHEHLHAFPALFTVANQLKAKFGIEYLRYPDAEWSGIHSFGALPRNFILQAMKAINRHELPDTRPMLIGVGVSGRLNFDYLRMRLATLKKGHVYELMCHPGASDKNDRFDRFRNRYHHWEEELAALCDKRLPDLCLHHGVRLVRFRELKSLVFDNTNCNKGSNL